MLVSGNLDKFLGGKTLNGREGIESHLDFFPEIHKNWWRKELLC